MTSAESTELFVGPADAPLQLVRVGYADSSGGVLRVDGDGLTGEAEVPAGDGVVEVPVTVERPVVGQRRAARVGDFDFEFTVAEPGWTMYMISHFHYDPVWWNTQAGYTSVWHEEPPGRARQNNGFALVAAHLEMARRDPDYKFVLAEVDYLKPYFDTHPEDRADLRRFIADGRVEVMGGTYNEPNTNLTGPETSIRNFVHGIGFQRDVLGAHPATAWQLDVFGHDPQFPGMAADAGLTSSSWARGPHHQWGPMAGDGDPRRMQFHSEFEWIAPSGLGLLTHYMPAHYSAGWWMDSSASLAEAEQATYELFAGLKSVALTRNVLLPVGTDYTPPNAWVTEIHRDWNARYTWPRFVCALPSEFFAAVRADGAAPSPQTRDMNPIYTGKDVSYIDTKQANRAAEDAVLGAERFAVFAALLTGARYPEAALAKAWVQLAYGAHHDAITGSESDQVYLDLLTGWRDAWELGRGARAAALGLLSQAVAHEPGSVVVWNPLAHNRTDIVTARLDTPVAAGVTVLDADGTELPTVVSDDGHLVSWRAADVGSLGWRTYRMVPSDEAGGWKPLRGNEIGNDHHRLRVDPARGGGVVSLVDLDDDVELIAAGGVGNELAVYEEYPAHPQAGEGPWHLLPKGDGRMLVGHRRRLRAGLPQPARRTDRRARPHRRHPALHPGADAVARHRPGGHQHHDRRVHRRRPAGAAALAVPGARRAAGQRGRRRRRRPRVRAHARPRHRRGPRRRLRRTSLDPGQPRPRLVRAVVGGADPDRRAHPRGVGGRSRCAVAGHRVGIGARVDGRAGARRRHRHLRQRAVSPLRPPRGRLQPARRPHRPGRPRRQRFHRRGARGRRPRLHRRTAPPAVRHRAGPDLGAGRPRRWTGCGSPTPTCATRWPCRCSSSPDTGPADWPTPSPPWSTTSTTPRSRSPRTRRRTAATSRRAPSR